MAPVCTIGGQPSWARRGRRAQVRPAVLLVAVALLGLAAAGCKSGHSVNPTISAAVVAGSPGFAPPEVTVHTGDKVDLKVANTTDKPHGFDIDGYGLKPRVIEPGSTADVKFTARRAGTFRIFCQLHPKHQTATLVVL